MPDEDDRTLATLASGCYTLGELERLAEDVPIARRRLVSDAIAAIFASHVAAPGHRAAVEDRAVRLLDALFAYCEEQPPGALSAAEATDVAVFELRDVLDVAGLAYGRTGRLARAAASEGLVSGEALRLASVSDAFLFLADEIDRV